MIVRPAGRDSPGEAQLLTGDSCPPEELGHTAFEHAALRTVKFRPLGVCADLLPLDCSVLRRDSLKRRVRNGLAGGDPREITKHHRHRLAVRKVIELPLRSVAHAMTVSRDVKAQFSVQR
jgi:hypothetical protein